GTVVVDRDTGEPLGDLTTPGERVLAIRGSRGGRGNARFATSTNQAPRRADLGPPGPERWLHPGPKLLPARRLVRVPQPGKAHPGVAAAGGQAEDRRLSLHDARAHARHRARR